jgi:hypothetical protein
LPHIIKCDSHFMCDVWLKSAAENKELHSVSKLFHMTFGFNYCEYPVPCPVVSKTDLNQLCILCRASKEEFCADHSAGMLLRGRCFILRYCRPIRLYPSYR